MLTLSNYGVTWDEVGYFASGRSYFKWLQSPSLATVDQYWSITHEHPPLTKVLGGSTNEIFNVYLGWFEEHVAYRISLIAFIVPLTLTFFSFARIQLGTWPAFFVSLALIFHPHLFFHSHIGAMDYAITAMWFATAYALWRSEDSLRWVFLASIALGLSLLTKINGFALYVIVAVVLLMRLTHDFQSGRAEMEVGQQMRAKQRLTSTLVLTAIPVLIFYAGWPWLWQNPVARFRDYIAFFSQHSVIPTYFFGTQYFKAPWYIPPVLLLLVTPIWIVLLFLAGLFSKTLTLRVRFFLVANLVLALGIIAISPSKHDGIRLFLPAVPFFYLIAGAGLVTTYEYFWKRVQNWKHARLYPLMFSALAVGLLSLTLVQSVIRYRSYQTAYFNEIVGGDSGAVAHGIEYEYWCSSYVEALEWLDKHSDNRFWIPICGHLFDYYYSRGLMKSRLERGDEAGSQYLVLPSRFGFFDQTRWSYFKYEKPVYSVRAYKENVLNIYALHGTRAPGSASIEVGQAEGNRQR